MSTDGCIFCKIVAGEIPAEVVWEDEEALAFRDIDPRAPTHVLVIPRRHIPAVNALEEADAALVGRLFLGARAVARAEGVADAGYRLVMNNGAGAGQSVDHIHLHLLAGRALAWPPG
ncbi:MAG: histidine triad nucleotide-binding protein [Gemmatimonadota bacterium]